MLIGVGVYANLDDDANKFERKNLLKQRNEMFEALKIVETINNVTASQERLKNCLRKNVGRQTFEKLCFFT